MSSKYLNIIGIAYRARQLSTGEHIVLKDIQTNRAKLVLIANDIGHQTKKKITDKCETYNVPYKIVDDRETIAKAIGKSSRVVIAILDEGFAQKVQSLLL